MIMMMMMMMMKMTMIITSNGSIRGMPATSVIYTVRRIELTKKKDTQDYLIYVISVIF